MLNPGSLFMATKVVLRIALLSAGILFSNVLSAGDYNRSEEGYTLHGYDPVSYFQGQPLVGNDKWTVTASGVHYRFASESNRQRFLNKPEVYQPRFGGYCSYGVRMGKKLDIDPEAYAIEDGRLYLLLNRATKTLWDKDRKRNIAIADRLWPSIRSLPAKELK